MDYSQFFCKFNNSHEEANQKRTGKIKMGRVEAMPFPKKEIQSIAKAANLGLE
ncbi:MAG: hypothetical protein H6581_14900 [Bacteroidia bacterium]|nr:hypothetical protein [Bacteroidia bacterium]